MDRKKINSFKGFITESRKQKLQESKVEIQVDWWDQCITEVLEILKKETCGCFTMERLLDYIITKNSILGRTTPNFDDAILVNHIKDLIFICHGDSFMDDKSGSFNIDNVEIHSKALAIEELANTILGKVREQAERGNSDQTCKVELYDQPDDDFLEYDEDEIVDDQISYERKNFLNLEDYTQLLKESTAEVTQEHSDECLKYVMDRIENNARFERMTDSKAIRMYLCELAKEYLRNKDINFKVDDKQVENAANIKESALDSFAQSIASKAIKKIAKRNKK